MLEYRVEREGERVEIALRGALAEEEWTDRLLEFLEDTVLTTEERVIGVNLEEVRQIDLEGVATLIRLAGAARDRGKRLVVRGADGAVRDKLERTGVLEFLSAPPAAGDGGTAPA